MKNSVAGPDKSMDSLDNSTDSVVAIIDSHLAQIKKSRGYLAELLDVSPSYLSSLLRSNRPLPAKILNKSIHELKIPGEISQKLIQMNAIGSFLLQPDIINPDALGVIGGTNDYPKKLFFDLAANAKKGDLVQYWGFWLDDIYYYREAFKAATENGAFIQILLQEEDSKANIEWARQLEYSELMQKTVYKNEIKRSLSDLELLCEDGIEIEVRLDDTWIPAELSLVGDIGIAGFFWQKLRSDAGPHIIFRKDSSFGQICYSQFEYVWNRSEDRIVVSKMTITKK